MFCHIAVEDSPTVMCNDEEAIKHAGGHRRNGEEVHRRNSFTMVAQKCRPLFCRLRIPLGRIALMMVAAALLSLPVWAQDVWQMQESGTTAGLRGSDSVDGTVAWASGTGGTVLRTVDGGAHWTQCAVPDGDKDGATLDFRGVQAFDANTAIIMSSGKGKLSRLYKTTNGCKSWKKIFVNPDKDGFWDAIYFGRRHDKSNDGKVPWWLDGWLLGDPVNGIFTVFSTGNLGKDWLRQKNIGLRADPAQQGAFAASNSSFIAVQFGSGGSGGAFVYRVKSFEECTDCSVEANEALKQKDAWAGESVPIGDHTASSGIFSIAGRSEPRSHFSDDRVLIAVGGDYSNPNNRSDTAAFKLAIDQPWIASTSPPHGYRSTVQWSEDLKLWITAGTNGSDISRDDGKTWQPLDNGNWNALSLPFVVGPKGRIGRLNAVAIPKP